MIFHEDSDIPKEDWEKDFMKNHRSRSQIQRLIRPEEIGRKKTASKKCEFLLAVFFV
jgi:(p)ppGpp synthase/HD superfamily hydrolase